MSVCYLKVFEQHDGTDIISINIFIDIIKNVQSVATRTVLHRGLH